jgi:hypothetical protein
MKGNDCDFAIHPVVVELERSGDSADGFPNPTGIYPWAYGFDDACSLVTVLGWGDRGFEVLAVAKHDLGAIKTESLDAETHFTGPWFRKR